jgi:hypothetical protein
MNAPQLIGFLTNVWTILIQDVLCYVTLREEHKVLIQVSENTHLNVTLTWVTFLIHIPEVPALTLNPENSYSAWGMAVPWLKQQVAGLMS